MNILKDITILAAVAGCFLFFGYGSVPVCAEIVNGIEGGYEGGSPNAGVVEVPGNREKTDDSEEVGNAVVINFDGVTAPCLFADTVALKGTFGGAKFKGKGKGNGGAIIDQCGNFLVTGHSPPNFLAFNCSASLKGGGHPRLPESITFLTPSTGDVTLRVGSYDNGQVKITAVKTNGPNVIKTVTLTNAMQTVTLPGPGVKKIKIKVGQSGCVLVVDDITY